ncbi:anthranilate phosphoribosyltransferase [Brevibacterium sp. 5221]|uniref:Anthranilate phosphoribosyltransferase n=1 Tax=Brevibacterium rongguiense TaxID=2695267 RepID=A0A6N9H9P6_9MICO|nr:MULTISPECIES: anthranilate phosphoribosyltransferase [Brevibacterium]MYM20244.1 anthranilate phosphoribosyltransferase [Brevibacterium rongguiense]WAL41579.1 anthranilate phosphoribosyltransferase [Brevibacterium sp. BRM-1]
MRGVRDWPELLVGLMAGRDMDAATAAWSMDEIMSGDVPDVTMAAFLVAHHGKGETVEEITGLVASMMSHAVALPGLEDAVDIVGTGGDRAKTVNISSTASFVIAGAGQRLVKHGNRATSSASGSADVLERLGLVLDLTPEQTGRAAREVGMAFCFANVYHPSMRFIAPVRKQIAVPSAFNILGPLTNPARTRATAIGVADPKMAPLVAGVLAARGDSAVVFRSRDGLDELSTTAVNDVWEVRDGGVAHTEFDAREVGLPRAAKDELRGGDPAFNADVMRSVLGGTQSPVRDVVLLNAAAALVAADPSAQGPFEQRVAGALERAREALDTGRAAAKLDELITVSRELRSADRPRR